MMASSEVSASPNGTQWKSVESHVLNLQMRITKATREGKHCKARALQWILTHSRSAKLLALERVALMLLIQWINTVIWTWLSPSTLMMWNR